MAYNFWTPWAKKSYIPHSKVLVNGINASSSQWCGCIFTMCYTHLNLALLFHKTVLVTFLLASTLCCFSKERHRSVIHALHLSIAKVEIGSQCREKVAHLENISKFRTSFWECGLFYDLSPIGSIGSYRYMLTQHLHY